MAITATRLTKGLSWAFRTTEPVEVCTVDLTTGETTSAYLTFREKANIASNALRLFDFVPAGAEREASARAILSRLVAVSAVDSETLVLSATVAAGKATLVVTPQAYPASFVVRVPWNAFDSYSWAASDLTGGGGSGGGGGGSGTVTSVNVSGGTTGLTASGGPVTAAGTITLGGTLTVANGGTGTATLPAEGKLLIGKADGSYAVANITAGANVSITNGNGSITISASGGGGGGGAVNSVTATSPLSTTGTTDVVVALTDIVPLELGGTNNGTWNPGAIPLVNGTADTMVGLSGDVPGDVITWNGSTWVPNGIVDIAHGGTNAESFNPGAVLVVNGTGDTVIGRNGDAGDVLIYDGSTWLPGGPVDIAHGGTNAESFNPGAVLVVNGSGDTVIGRTGVAGDVLLYDGSTWLAGGPVDIAHGGTNAESFDPGAVLVVNGSGDAVLGRTGAAGDVLVYDGSTWLAGGPIDIAHGGTNAASFSPGAIPAVNGSGDAMAGIVGDASGDILRWDGSAWLPTALVIGITEGGTGLNTPPATGELLVGNGTGYSLSKLTAGTNITIDDTSIPGEITISATGGSSGPLSDIFTSGEALAIGDVVYIGADGKVRKAIATALSTSTVVGVAAADVAGADLSVPVYTFNKADCFPATLVPGTEYFLSATVAGALVDYPTLSGSSGAQVVVLGYARSNTALHLNIYRRGLTP